MILSILSAALTVNFVIKIVIFPNYSSIIIQFLVTVLIKEPINVTMIK